MNDLVQLEVAENQQEDFVEEDEDLNDWNLIEENEVPECITIGGIQYRPPDYLNDPFKDKWKNTVAAYTKKSKFGNKRTFALKPFMVKANDDCRQEVMAMQLIKRL